MTVPASRAQALRRAEDFRANRLPRFIGWFETLLERIPPNATAHSCRTWAARA